MGSLFVGAVTGDAWQAVHMYHAGGHVKGLAHYGEARREGRMKEGRCGLADRLAGKVVSPPSSEPLGSSTERGRERWAAMTLLVRMPTALWAMVSLISII